MVSDYKSNCDVVDCKQRRWRNFGTMLSSHFPGGYAIMGKVRGLLGKVFAERKRIEFSDEDYRKADRLALELRARLPNEFTLGGKEYPDLHFKADPDIPGLFIAEINDEFWLGRKGYR